MERSLPASRVATFVYCDLDGTLMGMWLVQIPAVEKRVGISHAALGSLRVLLGHGAFIGMQVAGRLPDRLGTRLVVPASGVLCGASLVLSGLAREPWALAGALLVFGFGGGCLDVSMNAHAVHVEKAYNRRIIRLARHLLRRRGHRRARRGMSDQRGDESRRGPRRRGSRGHRHRPASGPQPAGACTDLPGARINGRGNA